MTVREIAPEVLEVAIDSAPALMWAAIVGLVGATTAYFSIEAGAWLYALAAIVVAGGLIALIIAGGRVKVHTIDRRWGRIAMVTRRWRRDLSRREVELRFLRDVVLDETTKTRTSAGDNTKFDVPVYRVVYELQDGTRIPWTDDYMEFGDGDFASVDRVRAALGLETRPRGDRQSSPEVS